jgi:hypothetical protein
MSRCRAHANAPHDCGPVRSRVDRDYVLVDLGGKETLLVVGDWFATIDAPVCYQRTILGAVVDGLVIDP